MVKQGDIIKVNFNPKSGHEQAGYRSAVVISNNIFNQKTGLTVVCPITNTDNHFPLHIPLDSRTKTTGVILCEHVRTLDLKGRGYQLIEKIQNAKTESIFITPKEEQNNFEKALQRLVILGVVNNYSIDYSSNEYNLIISNITTNEIINNYGNYVNGYNKGRTLTEKNKLRKYSTLNKMEFIKKATHVLIEFVYDTIEKGRRRGLREIYELAKEAVSAENQDLVIKTRINQYIGSNFSTYLDEIIEKEKINLMQIVILFEGKVIENEQVDGIRSISELKQLRGEASRYLETTPDHPSLLFIRSLTEVFMNNNNDILKEDFENGILFAINRYQINENELYKFIRYYLTQIYDNKFDLYVDLLNIAMKSVNDKYKLTNYLINSVDDNNEDIISIQAMTYLETSLVDVLENVNKEGEQNG